MVPPFTVYFAGPHRAGRLRDPRRDEPGTLLSIVLSSFHQNLPNSLLCFQRWPVTIIAYLLFWTFLFIGNDNDLDRHMIAKHIQCQQVAQNKPQCKIVLTPS